MTRIKSKSFINKFFYKSTQSNQSADKQLIDCLYQLSVIGEGKQRDVDLEITKLKQLINSNAPVTALHQQVNGITSALLQSTANAEISKQAQELRQFSAVVLIDEIIELPLSDNLKNKFINYRNALAQTVPLSQVLPDLVTIFDCETELSQQDKALLASEEQLRDVASPMLKLLTDIDIPEKCNEQLTEITGQGNQIQDLQQLIRFLEDSTHFVLTSINKSCTQFESFLKTLNKRMDIVNAILLNNHQNYSEVSECSDNLSDYLSQQITSIQSSFQQHTDIIALENNITQNLQLIIDEVSNFDTLRHKLKTENDDRVATLNQELELMRVETNQLKDSLEQQRLRSLTDPLTDLPNRYAFDERQNLEYERWRRYNQNLSVAIADIDEFKTINDTYGHQTGDMTLRHVAKVLKDGIRETDFIARFGGEEFIIILPETCLTESVKAANKYRNNVQKANFSNDSGNFNITMSFGVATFEAGDTFSSVLTRADQAMYRAKTKGKNLVCVQRKNKQLINESP